MFRPAPQDRDFSNPPPASSLFEHVFRHVSRHPSRQVSQHVPRHVLKTYSVMRTNAQKNQKKNEEEKKKRSYSSKLSSTSTSRARQSAPLLRRYAFFFYLGLHAYVYGSYIFSRMFAVVCFDSGTNRPVEAITA